MKHARYYLSGNGYDTWTIELWNGKCNFQLIETFQLRATPNPKRELSLRIRQQTKYVTAYLQAAKKINQLSESTKIPIVGGLISFD